MIIIAITRMKTCVGMSIKEREELKIFSFIITQDISLYFKLCRWGHEHWN